MAFRTNSYQQLSFTDSFGGLTSREQKALERSWAKVFAEDIFPAINEEPFRVLYSSNASRPNTPVNVCIGALIIKEIFGISDDEVVENLMLDPRYQYALHTTSFDEQPMSDKTLSHFRKRCYDYESIYGVDLLHDCMTGIGANIAKLKMAKAQEEQAKLSFQQTLLNAGSEVSNALSLYQKTSEKVESRQMQVESAKKASEDTKELFNLGTSTYLEVLSAEQSYLSAQLAEVSDTFSSMQAVISLYQALGGGRE